MSHCKERLKNGKELLHSLIKTTIVVSVIQSSNMMDVTRTSNIVLLYLGLIL